MLEVHFTGAADFGRYLSAVVAGPPGHGKTRFCATAKDPFFLNAEGGLMSIARKNLPAAKITSSEDLSMARNILTLGPEKAAEVLTGGRTKTIGTVVLDTFDEFSRILIRERLERMGNETMQVGDWSWLNDQLNAMVRGFRNLDMHVIFTCHVKDQTDGETGSVYYKLDVPGQIAHQLPGAVDLSLLLRTHDVLVHQEGADEAVKERQSALFTTPDSRYEWVKDRSGKLDEVIELNFEDDFQKIVSAVFGDVDGLPTSEPIEVNYSAASEDAAPVSETKVQPTAPATVEEKTVAVEEADKAIAEAEAAAKAKKEESASKTLANPTDLELEYASVDLTDVESGSMIQVEGDIPNGFQLNKDNTGTQVRKVRFVYEVDGKKILSRNQLESGVSPILNPEVASGIFCQATGVEITRDEANLSMIRLSQMVCEDVMEVRTDRTPANKN